MDRRGEIIRRCVQSILHFPDMCLILWLVFYDSGLTTILEKQGIVNVRKKNTIKYYTGRVHMFLFPPLCILVIN